MGMLAVVGTACHCTTAPATVHGRLAGSVLLPGRRLHPLLHRSSLSSGPTTPAASTEAAFLLTGRLSIQVGLSQLSVDERLQCNRYNKLAIRRPQPVYLHDIFKLRPKFLIVPHELLSDDLLYTWGPVTTWIADCLLSGKLSR